MGDEYAIIKAYSDRADGIVERAKRLSITSPQEREFVATVALEARFLDDEADEKEKEITRPINEGLKKIRELFEFRKKLKEVQNISDGKLKEIYLDEEDARRNAEASSNIEAQKTDGEDYIPFILPETEKTICTSLGKITIRNDIKVTLSSEDEAFTGLINGKLPRSIFKIDLGAAKRYFKAAGIKRAPGFLIEDDAIVAGRK